MILLILDLQLSYYREESNGEHIIIHNTFQKDPTNSLKELWLYIFIDKWNLLMKHSLCGVIDKLFFSDQRYSLGANGRHRINNRLKIDTPEDKYVLTNEDIIEIIKQLIELTNSKVDVDDIGDLILILVTEELEQIGDQLSNQFYIGSN